MPALTKLFSCFIVPLSLIAANEHPSLYPSKKVETKDAFARILHEVVTIPLRGRRVTLILEEDPQARTDTGASFDVDEASLITRIGVPISLLHLPEDMPTNELANSSDTEGKERHRNFVLESSIVVLVINSASGSWWPLQNPPEAWRTTAIVLLSTRRSCLDDRFLQSSLLSRTPSVALICPYKSRGKRNDPEMSFGVWTWKTYSRKFHLIDLGPWNSEAFSSWDRLFVDRFDDMSKKELSILAHTLDLPLLYEGFDGKLKGTNYNLMWSIASFLHCSLNFSGTTDMDFADVFESVKEGDTDFAINFSLMTVERSREYHMTVPYLLEGYVIMIEVPPPLPRWKNIFYPFTSDVWIGIVLSMSVTSLIHHILNYKNEKSFITNSLTVMQSLLSNPLAIVPENWRIRSFFLWWWLGAWILSISYTSNLIAVLTVPVFPKLIETMQGFADSKYRLCIVNFGDPVSEALETSDHPVLAELGRKLDRVPLEISWDWSGLERCFYKVLNGTHAHIETYSFGLTIYGLLGYNKMTYKLKERLYPGYSVLLVNKHSPFRYKIDTAIQRLLEGGLIGKWYQDTMGEFEDSSDSGRELKLQPFSLSHLQGQFFLFVGGILLSLLVFFIEYVNPTQ